MTRIIKGHGRYFIVGSARSGTTLLQAMVASHPRVFTVPETHFFCEAVYGGRRGRLGLARKKAAREVLQIVQRSAGGDDLSLKLPSINPFLGSYVKVFVDIMDRAAFKRGNDIWVEKTPHHISYLPVISKTIHGARFIHIVRHGRDVLASQRYAMGQDPTYWAADRWPLDRMINRWNDNTRSTLAHTGDPDHFLVTYETLILQPEMTLRSLAGFMGMDFNPAMLRHWEAADAAAGWRKSHPWMAGSFNPLIDTRLRKFHQVFSADEQAHVSEGLLAGGEIQRLLCVDGRSAA